MVILCASFVSGCATRGVNDIVIIPQPPPPALVDSVKPQQDAAKAAPRSRLSRAERRESEMMRSSAVEEVAEKKQEIDDDAPAESRPGFFARMFASRDEADVESPEITDNIVEQTPEQPSDDFPDEPPAGMMESAAEITLRPGLVLEVAVLVAGQKEIETQATRVSDSGNIVLPLLGTVKVNTYTIEALQDILTERYSRYFVNPQVMIQFTSGGSSDGVSPWGYVTVLGRVKTPGPIMIPATRDLTVSGAIQRAGGFDTSARVNAIRVTRRNSNGETDVRVINLNSVGSSGRLDDDILLFMNDVVFVPEARF